MAAEQRPSLPSATGAELLSHRTAAELVGLSPRSILRLWSAGKFPVPVRVPGLRGLRFRRSDVAAWLEELPRA